MLIYVAQSELVQSPNNGVMGMKILWSRLEAVAKGESNIPKLEGFIQNLTSLSKTQAYKSHIMYIN